MTVKSIGFQRFANILFLFVALEHRSSEQKPKVGFSNATCCFCLGNLEANIRNMDYNGQPMTWRRTMKRPTYVDKSLDRFPISYLFAVAVC